MRFFVASAVGLVFAACSAASSLRTAPDASHAQASTDAGRHEGSTHDASHATPPDAGRDTGTRDATHTTPPDSGVDTGAHDAGHTAIPDASSVAPGGPIPGVGAGTAFTPSYLCASGGTCTGHPVTGGGAFPDLSAATLVTCPMSPADSTACLNALTSAPTSTPLVFPAGASYTISNVLLVLRPLIGASGGAQPAITTTSCTNAGGSGDGTANCASATNDTLGGSCSGSVLWTPGFVGSVSTLWNPAGFWIYNLALHGNACAGDQEYSQVLDLGGAVTGVTVKGNTIEYGSDGTGDGSIDGGWNASGLLPSTNVLLDGNTFDHNHRTCVALTNRTDRWAFLNNKCSYTGDYGVETNPWDTEISMGGTPANGYSQNVEVGYNWFNTVDDGSGVGGPSSNSMYEEGVLSITGNGGSCNDYFIHHNYGTPWGLPFLVTDNSTYGRQKCEVDPAGGNMATTTCDFQCGGVACPTGGTQYFTTSCPDDANDAPCDIGNNVSGTTVPSP